MDKKELEVVTTNDWEDLYYNGEPIFSGHIAYAGDLYPLLERFGVTIKHVAHFEDEQEEEYFDDQHRRQEAWKNREVKEE